jgi:hypothetical protein
MKAKLIALGWVLYYECLTTCKKQYFNHPEKAGYEVRVRTANKTFSIILNNRIVSGPHWEYQLEEKLKANGL